jgi:hypothetical protein
MEEPMSEPKTEPKAKAKKKEPKVNKLDAFLDLMIADAEADVAAGRPVEARLDALKAIRKLK